MVAKQRSEHPRDGRDDMDVVMTVDVRRLAEQLPELFKLGDALRPDVGRPDLTGRQGGTRLRAPAEVQAATRQERRNAVRWRHGCSFGEVQVQTDREIALPRARCRLHRAWSPDRQTRAGNESQREAVEDGAVDIGFAEVVSLSDRRRRAHRRAPSRRAS